MRTFVDALLALIDAKIAAHAAADSSDGGLAESIRARELEEDLRIIVDIMEEA